MTAVEVVKVETVHHDERKFQYAPDADRNHDQYGCDVTDHHRFNHTEDVFPY